MQCSAVRVPIPDPASSTEFADDDDFKRWMPETVFRMTYQQPPPEDGTTDSD